MYQAESRWQYLTYIPCNVFGGNSDDLAVVLFELWHQGLQFVELRRRDVAKVHGVEENQDKLSAKRGQFKHLRLASVDEGWEREIFSLFSGTHCGSY